MNVSGLVIHTLKHPSFFDRSVIKGLPHEINCLLHTGTHLGAGLEVTVFIFVDNQVSGPISSNFLKSSTSNPAWIFLHQRNMFIDIPTVKLFLLSFCGSDSRVNNDLRRFVNLRISVRGEQFIDTTAELDLVEEICLTF